MDWRAFIASIFGSLAWPVVVMILLLLLRKHLPSLAERIEEITLPGGFKAKFDKALDEGRTESELVPVENWPVDRKVSVQDQRRLELAQQYPEAAVMDAYKVVEALLLQLRSRLGLPPRTNLRGVVHHLVEHGVLTREVQPLFESFQRARNASAHVGAANKITPGEAIAYMEQAELLATVFEDILNSRISGAGQSVEGSIA